MDNRTPSDHVFEVIVFMITSVSVLGVLWIINELRHGKRSKST